MMEREVIIGAAHASLLGFGDGVILAPLVQIVARKASMTKHMHHTRIAEVRIGDRVFVGAGATVLPGVAIRDNRIVGSANAVSRGIRDGQVASGSPATVVCSIDKFLETERREVTTCRFLGREYLLVNN